MLLGPYTPEQMRRVCERMEAVNGNVIAQWQTPEVPPPSAPTPPTPTPAGT
jgi:hypothetical protein